MDRYGKRPHSPVWAWIRSSWYGRSITGIIGAALVVVALPLLAWFAGQKMYEEDDPGTPLVPIAGDTTGSADTPPTVALSASSEPAATEATTSVSATSTSPPTTFVAASTTTRPSTTSTARPSTTATARRATTSSTPRTTTSSTGRTRTTKVVTYSTLPDGSPQPVIATFDVDLITLSGTVPSQAAADRLGALALANSKTPASLVKFLAIDPNVPKSLGVRVIELTSARFPENSAVILPDHALEFDRVATVMQALPNVTALVIGHADQRGSPADNFAISDARARATVSYLVGKGIDPDRLSSRAVGETDLLAVNNDATALALNRRTEFVFYGLIADT